MGSFILGSLQENYTSPDKDVKKLRSVQNAREMRNLTTSGEKGCRCKEPAFGGAMVFADSRETVKSGVAQTLFLSRSSSIFQKPGLCALTETLWQIRCAMAGIWKCECNCLHCVSQVAFSNHEWFRDNGLFHRGRLPTRKRTKSLA